MFNVSLSDRLKAAVNTLEQTGSSLQARAIGQGQAQASAQQPQSQSPTQSAGPSIARSISPNPKTPTGTTSATGQSILDGSALSPTRNYSTSQLAENALSGLRKSFQFGRDGHGRSASGTSTTGPGGDGVGVGGTGSGGQQELKDITSPTQLNGVGSSSRPSSPAPASSRFLSTMTGTGGGGSNFAIGGDTPSLSGTPSRPRSPNPSGLGQGHSQMTTRAQLATPHPDDPASYPLPPSATSATNPLPLLSPGQPTFADPLGASPSLTPQVPPDPPILGLHAPTPEDDENENAELESRTGSLKINAVPVMDTEVVQVVKKVEEAAIRYEGELIDPRAQPIKLTAGFRDVTEVHGSGCSGGEC